MQPFSFQFKHYPEGDIFDQSLIEYDENLNLSIDKSTRKPAICALSMATETFTRMNETADTDNQALSMMMATYTETKTSEGSDDDRSSVAMMMSTSTTTISADESSDDDRYGFH